MLSKNIYKIGRVSRLAFQDDVQLENLLNVGLDYPRLLVETTIEAGQLPHNAHEVNIRQETQHGGHRTLLSFGDGGA